ncbi:MAG: SH3 domain-containing protein [Synergistaceae bacterium]|nr:SH3 domain-containing protein [Synergistaceae bacterium]
MENGDLLEIHSEHKRPGGSVVWYRVTDKNTGLTGYVSSKYVRIH